MSSTVSSVATSSQTPSIGDFTAEVEAFLSSRYQPKREHDERFVWGVGPDRFPNYVEPTAEEQLEELAAVRLWRGELFDAGLAWITGPSDFGGRELPGSYQRAFDGVARRYEVPGNGLLRVGLGMVVPTLLAHGTDGHRQQYLLALLRGETVGCQLFSEPGAGSDLASVETKAKVEGNAWVVTGSKVWVSGAHHADMGLLLCRTSEGARHRNLTMFVLDMHAPGVVVQPIVQMTGGSFFNEVFIDGVVIPDELRVGDVNGGWQVAMTTLSNERDSIGGDGLGGSGVLSSDRLIALARHFECASDPVLRQELASLLIGLRIARYTRMRANGRRQAGFLPGPEMSLSKLALARNTSAVASYVGRVLGPRLIADGGEWGTYAWADVVLNAPSMRIGGGTDEVMKNVIAERVLGLPKDSSAH
jgi:alkylation response protein AidB-like acyl-CoA dehydrogenase